MLSETDRAHPADDIVGHASSENAVESDVRRRVAEYWTNVDPELGARVSKGLNGG